MELTCNASNDLSPFESKKAQFSKTIQSITLRDANDAGKTGS